MEDFYKILGVSKDSSQEAIRTRYLFLVKAYHPDRYVDSNDKKTAEEELKKINQAYEIIGNLQKKQKYDRDNSFQTEKEKNQNNTTQEKNEIDEIVNYLGDVLQKWKYQIQHIDDSIITCGNQEKLLILSKNILTNCESIPFSKEKIILGNLYAQIILLRNMGISLGFERNKKPALKYPIEKCCEIASYFLIISYAKFIETLPEKDKQDENVQTLLKKIPQLSLMIANEMVIWGSNYFETHDLGSTKHSSDNAQKESDLQYGFCQKCGSYSPLYLAKYRKNIGMVFFRRYFEFTGEFCTNCHEQLFWNVFLTNLFLGWWGTISFIINPFLIIMNIQNYLKSWKTRKESGHKDNSPMDWKLIGVIGIFLLFLIFIFSGESAMNNQTANQKIISTTRISSPTPYKPISTLSRVAVINPTTSSDKVIVTVINHGSIPQDVYVDGIYIFTIQTNETKSFRFSKGTWQIHLCYPGNFPCDNKYLEDMTNDTFKFTIN